MCVDATAAAPVPTLLSEEDEVWVTPSAPSECCASCGKALGITGWFVVVVNCLNILHTGYLAYELYLYVLEPPKKDENAALALVAFLFFIPSILDSIAMVALAAWALHREYRTLPWYAHDREGDGQRVSCGCYACCIVACVCMFLISCGPTAITIPFYRSVRIDHMRTPTAADLSGWLFLLMWPTVTLSFAVFAVVLCIRIHPRRRS